MDQNEFRKLKESGELVGDAGQQELQDATTEIIDDQFQDEELEAEEVEEEIEQDTEEDELEDAETTEEEEPEQLTPKEKTAFDKRLERDKAKIEEKIRTEMEEQFKQKYSKHDEAIQLMGGDPDKILQAAKDAQLQREAQRLAEANDWSPEDTQWYVQQQKKDQRLQELEVTVQINELKDKPEYAGIGTMKQTIIDKINASKGVLTVDEAFWALGGAKRVEQIKLEEQQRNVAKRTAQTRTVQKDTPSTTTGEKPLPPNILREAERMGISPEEARKLMSTPVAQNIDEYRKNKAK